MKGAPSATVAEYTYDALGRRIKKIADSTTTLYFYNGNWQVLAETNGSGTVQRQYIYGNYLDEVLVMMTDDGSSQADYYYAHDHLYSPVALLTDTGQVAERMEYDAYGTLTCWHVADLNRDGVIDSIDSTLLVDHIVNGDPYNWYYDLDNNGSVNSLDYLNMLSWSRNTPARPAGQFSFYSNPIAFTGQRFDSETGNYHYRNRNYDAYLGRFMQQDPLGVVPNAFKPNRFDPRNQYQDGMNVYKYAILLPIENARF